MTSENRTTSNVPNSSSTIDSYKFSVPPEALVFYPNEEEFRDPLDYINKIRPIAENTGICKIKPPSSWRPPFVMNVDKVWFTPIIQKLNQLEATTRVKLDFLLEIAKFWRFQGSPSRTPMVEKKVLDLYTLRQYVKEEGGFDAVTKKRKWSKIAVKMGYRPDKGTVLKSHCEKFLNPYDAFKEDKNLQTSYSKRVAFEAYKHEKAFGFQQAQRKYNLQQFCKMANRFKRDYFKMAAYEVPTNVVEKEFWRIVSSIDENVTVEYGTDLHVMDHGSGFPTPSSSNLSPSDLEYAYSGWNLNNLPNLKGSVLGYIDADISGIKIPWMYVGMCFSTFCWHNEDHWSYSINYLHWGEPKTWYGVPGSKAVAFEEAMRSAAPELFQSQPDLLHHLVTIMNPNILMNAGVPVFRTDQYAGEFVVTFPRAYHAGFNQGYNFAEAVNFALADWLKIGRESVLHYSALRRFCVFSHDELICKMALQTNNLTPLIATATYEDMLQMVDIEKELRNNVLNWGIVKVKEVAFELLLDDQRQCEFCKTTCFLSAVTCSCAKGKLVCLRHYADICNCPPDKHNLLYRYNSKELMKMLQNVKAKAFELST